MQIRSFFRPSIAKILLLLAFLLFSLLVVTGKQATTQASWEEGRGFPLAFMTIGSHCFGPQQILADWCKWWVEEFHPIGLAVDVLFGYLLACATVKLFDAFMPKKSFERFLNLNGPGTKILVGILVLGLGIPGLVLALQWLGLEWSWLPGLAFGSLCLGGSLLVVFTILVGMELTMDNALYRRYQAGLRKRIPLADGLSECPYCGCRRVRDFEQHCPVCGKVLE